MLKFRSQEHIIFFRENYLKRVVYLLIFLYN
nr:MAG TPA: hypothetical protein [Caudoviricetes sp.]